MVFQDGYYDEYQRIEISVARRYSALLTKVLGEASPANRAVGLDVGCATASELRVLKKFVEGCLVGVDVSSYSLSKIKEKIKGFNVELVCADARYLPFKKGTFELVTCVNVIEHVPGSAPIQELDRITKVNGFILLVTDNRWSPYNYVVNNVIGRRTKRNVSPYYHCNVRSPLEVWRTLRLSKFDKAFRTRITTIIHSLPFYKQLRIFQVPLVGTSIVVIRYKCKNLTDSLNAHSSYVNHD